MIVGETAQERAFARALWLLREYLPDLVVIGGWVPYLYKHFGGLQWVGQQSRTAEIDVLTMPPLAVHGGSSLDGTLRAAGLRPQRDDGPSAVWEAFGEFNGRLQQLPVRVPRLGVYVINKAATVLARQAHASGPNPKQAKDLVYLHDVMAAGEPVRQRVEADIAALWATNGRNSAERGAIRSATNNVTLLLGGTFGLITSASQELGTRDSQPWVIAAAAIRGQLTDLLELLRNIQARRRHPRS